MCEGLLPRLVCDPRRVPVLGRSTWRASTRARTGALDVGQVSRVVVQLLARVASRAAPPVLSSRDAGGLVTVGRRRG